MISGRYVFIQQFGNIQGVALDNNGKPFGNLDAQSLKNNERLGNVIFQINGMSWFISGRFPEQIWLVEDKYLVEICETELLKS